MEGIENLMNSLIQGNPGSFKIEFDREMQNRINGRLDDYKGYVAANFTNPELSYSEYREAIEANNDADHEVDDSESSEEVQDDDNQDNS